MTVVKNKNAIIWGASSGVGRALATYLASLNYDLLICARSERDLSALTSDLENKFNVKINYLTIDINSEKEVSAFFENKNINSFNEIYITVGKVYEIDNGEQGDAVVNDLVLTNYISPVKLINGIIANYQNINRLRILIISSIAVSRPRRNNMIYSSAKMALDFYCQALQHKLLSTNLSICVCRLGYVDTEMVYGKKLLFPVANSIKVARKLHFALNNNRRLFYIPRFWKIIKFGINLIPWSVYKRLNF